MKPLVAAAAAFTLSIFLSSAVRGANTEEGGYQVIANAFGFGCQIDGAAEASKYVRDIQIDDLSIDVLETNVGTDRHYAPGAVKWGNMKISSALLPGGKPELGKWFADNAGGKSIRKNITVTLFKSDKSPGRSYRLIDCEPVKYHTESDANGVASLEVIEVKPRRIDFITYRPTTRNQRGGSAGAKPDAPLVYKGFEVELRGPGGVETDSAWESVSGASVIIDLTAPNSTESFKTNSPGHKTVGEITLRGAMTDQRKALCDWLNETVSGLPWRRTLTLTELLAAGSGVVQGDSHQLVEALPVRYRFPRLSTQTQTGNAEEEVELRLVRNVPELPPNAYGQIQIPDAPVASKAALLIAIDDLGMDVANIATCGDARNQTAIIAVSPGAGQELQAWFKEAAEGKIIRKDITIELLKDGKPTGRRYNLIDCFPVNFEAGEFSTGAEANVDMLVVKVDRIEMA